MTTNRIYIGSTSNTFHHRWKQHLNALNANRHENPKLQNTFNKYKTLISEEIEYVNGDETKLLSREQFYIDKLKSKNIDMFNLSPVTGTIKGYKWSEKSKLDRCGKGNPMYGKGYTRIGNKNPAFNKPVSKETRQKISKESKKIKRDYLKQYLSIPILQYSKDGKFIKKYASMSDASNELNINEGHISCVCNGKRKSAGGFIWRKFDIKLLQ